MKKLFTLSLLAVSFFSSKAQVGSVLVGGDAGLSSQKNTITPFGEQKSTSFNLSPYVGYQFTDNWTAGVKLGYSMAKTTSEPSGDVYKANNFSAGPFVRYTKNLSDIFSLYGQFDAQFGKGKTKNNGTTTSESSGSTFNLFPAVFVNLKNNFGLNFNFGGISYASAKPGNGSKSTAFNINFGSTANIGISKNFGGKSK